MSDRPTYEVVVVGGGPAGLTTALYTIRLGHRTAVFEKTGGRHTVVEGVHNLFGVSEEVSGSELSALAGRQFEEYGGDHYPDAVTGVREREDGDGFVVEAAHATVAAERLVLATGFTDEGPDVPGLERFTGRGLHYCIHCDAYTLGDDRVFVLGHDDHAAEVALMLLNVTADVELLLDGREPTWSEATARQVEAHPVGRVDTEVVGAFPEDPDAAEPWLGGLTFAEGTDREYRGGFAVYGKRFNTKLAEDVGCELTDAGGIDVNDVGETSVDGVYAVGDVTHGQNQTTVAIGDGARAGIALHKDLRTFPVPLDELDGDELPAGIDAPAASASLRARMRRDRAREEHAGLRAPRPDL
jgi:thioredoxin reductase (NADPH)